MTDLVIGGGRRFQPQRLMRTIAIGLVLLVLGAVVAYVVFGRMVAYVEPAVTAAEGTLDLRPTDPQTQPGTVALGVGAGTMSHVGGLTVLRLAGPPAALGADHGRLLGAFAAPPSAALGPTLDGIIDGTGVLARASADPRLRWTLRFVDDGIPGHQLVEIANLVAAANRDDDPVLDYEQFVRNQVALDVGVPAPWSSGAALRTVSRSLGVVAQVRDPGGDRLLVGHTLSLAGVGDGGDAAARMPVVSLIQPADVLGFASVGWPGLVGAVAGVNSEGIAVFLHPARTADVAVTKTAQPTPLLVRDILENARSLDDALKVLKHATVLGAASFLVVDGGARRWAVVERSPDQHAVRAGAQAPTVVTGVLTSEVFAQDPENDRAARTRPAVQRGERAERLLRQRVAGPADMVAILRDQSASDGAPLPFGHRGAVRDPSAVHTILLDVSTMVLWVADGADAGSRYRAFDLRHELTASPRAAPPDLPAESEYDPSASTRVRTARGYLRQARQQAAAERPHAPRELVLRALAGVPDLPEALLFAGELARERGDQEAAQRWFARALKVGIDDPSAGDKIRALLGP